MPKLSFLSLQYVNFATVLIAFIVSIPIHWTLLRLNSQEMIRLREDVLAVDQQSNGDIQAIEPSLTKLREYVTDHMGTAMGAPVILEYRYNRIFDQQLAQYANSDSAYRRSVYEAAITKCAAADQAVNERVVCIHQFIISQPGIAADEIKMPPLQQFSYDFMPPGWSPDLAGFSLILTISLGLTSLILVLTEVVLPRLIGYFREDSLE